MLLLSSEAGRIRQELEVMKSNLVPGVKAIQKEMSSGIPRVHGGSFSDRVKFPGEDVKLVIAGDSGTGKSSLAACWDSGSLLGDMESVCNVRSLMMTGGPLKVQLWDMEGQEEFRSFIPVYFRNADGVLLVYDIASRQSFESIAVWLSDVRSVKPELPGLIVAWDKKDREAVVSAEEGRLLAEDLGVSFAELYADQSVIEAEIVKFLEAEIIRRIDRHARYAQLGKPGVDCVVY
jgi:small GTP-binding protein